MTPCATQTLPSDRGTTMSCWLRRVSQPSPSMPNLTITPAPAAQQADAAAHPAVTARGFSASARCRHPAPLSPRKSCMSVKVFGMWACCQLFAIRTACWRPRLSVDLQVRPLPRPNPRWLLYANQSAGGFFDIASSDWSMVVTHSRPSPTGQSIECQPIATNAGAVPSTDGCGCVGVTGPLQRR